MDRLRGSAVEMAHWPNNRHSWSNEELILIQQLLNEHVRSIIYHIGNNMNRQHKAPSIYDVHTEGGSSSGGRKWTGEGVTPHVDVHTENAVFFSCKEVGIFLPEFCLWIGIKSGHFSAI